MAESLRPWSCEEVVTRGCGLHRFMRPTPRPCGAEGSTTGRHLKGLAVGALEPTCVSVASGKGACLELAPKSVESDIYAHTCCTRVSGDENVSDLVGCSTPYKHDCVRVGSSLTYMLTFAPLLQTPHGRRRIWVRSAENCALFQLVRNTLARTRLK